MKESFSFTKYAGSMEKAKAKMKSIESIEDQIESYHDDEWILINCYLNQGQVFC